VEFSFLWVFFVGVPKLGDFKHASQSAINKIRMKRLKAHWSYFDTILEGTRAPMKDYKPGFEIPAMIILIIAMAPGERW